MAMKTKTKVLTYCCCTALALAGLANEARADAWNKKTIMTISDPVQVPKVLLQPGKYVLKLADSQSDRHIVQIFNADESSVITTILAIPNYRLKPTGKSEFAFWETPAGQPRALRAWFYPGDNFGQEFAYPPAMSTQITTYSKESVPTTYSNSDEDLKTAKVEQTTAEPAPVEQPVVEKSAEQKAADQTPVVVAQNTPPPAPAPAPEPIAQQATPEQAERTVEQADQAPASLPQTASNYPLVALIGLLSLGAFAAMSIRSIIAKRY